MLDIVGRQIQIFDTGLMTEWMTPDELSELTSISLDRLKNLRYQRKLFPFHKIPGTRTVLYDRAEVMRIIESSRVDVRS